MSEGEEWRAAVVRNLLTLLKRDALSTYVVQRFAEVTSVVEGEAEEVEGGGIPPQSFWRDKALLLEETGVQLLGAPPPPIL